MLYATILRKVLELNLTKKKIELKTQVKKFERITQDHVNRKSGSWAYIHTIYCQLYFGCQATLQAILLRK